ncbi:unnamed protein product [Soboliphyme baturini]|uniref:Reverse transcriptase domain-containing protein n=1 Tax=Soboliphyme baturini TaxID=241478 RepID=A0A183J1A4_9BILA|nr:unnamed protein product [Soboliphyme baturini]
MKSAEAGTQKSFLQYEVAKSGSVTPQSDHETDLKIAHTYAPTNTCIEEKMEEFYQELEYALVPKSRYTSSWEISMPKPDEEGPVTSVGRNDT